jgi:autotransporter-associated beta strand protein
MLLTDASSARVGAAAVGTMALLSGVTQYLHTFATTALGRIFSGAINLIKNGPGILTLSGANTYTGTTSVIGGVLSIPATSNLPGFSTSGKVAVASGGTLAVGNSVTDAEITTILGAAQFVASSSLGFDTTAGNRTYGTAITGNIGLTKIGANTLTLSSAGSYAGQTRILEGTLATSAGNILPDATTVDISSGATLQLGGGDTIAAISGAGAVAMGANNLALSGSNTTTHSGTITSTTGGLTKSGTGTLTLSGTGSSLGGALQHQTGTLNLSGTLAIANNIQLAWSANNGTVNITGTLTQTGTSGPRGFQLAVNSNHVGTVNINSNVTLGSGFMLGDNGGGAGTLNVTGGTLTVTGQAWWAGINSTLNVSGGTVNASNSSTFLGGGSGAGTTSTITISGTGYYNAGTFWFGIAQIATAQMIVNLNGGTLSVGTLGSNTNGGTGVFHFNGGVFNVRSSVSIPTNVAGNIKAGGAVISTNTNATLTLTSALTDGGGGGGITKDGAGTLAMGNFAHAYTGSTTINIGTITVSKTVSGSTATATFTLTTIAVSFATAPAAGTQNFKFFPGATTQSYSPAFITLTGAPGRSATYDSTTSTLIVT